MLAPGVVQRPFPSQFGPFLSLRIFGQHLGGSVSQPHLQESRLLSSLSLGASAHLKVPGGKVLRGSVESVLTGPPAGHLAELRARLKRILELCGYRSKLRIYCCLGGPSK